MGPDHLSAYCLGLEPGTPLAGDVEEGRLPSPVDETARRLYELLVERVVGAGYELYEISNFARPGRASRHNTRYWTRADVIALGPSAHGLLENHRWANPAPLEAWVSAYSDGGTPPTTKPVPVELARFEWMFLHLRLADGFSKAEFADRWSASFDEVYGETVERLTAAGFLEDREDRVRLSTTARFVSDAVFAEFAP
jgi:oxygen-independent coproporphyrinogen-3 oxidase